jgi:hypothetical protein
MSIEDINYLKQNSIKQSYTFLVDSKTRNKKVHPNPSEYVIDFTTPFKNVVGIEVVDVSIPKTMYNIDYNNNKIFFTFATEVDVLKDNAGAEYYDKSIFTEIELSPGDYITKSFIDKMRITFLTQTTDITVNGVDTPPDLTNLIFFSASRPFILDMSQSTMAETIGFDMYTSSDTKYNTKYTYKHYNSKDGFEKLYHSIEVAPGIHRIYAPGMMYLLGNKYIILRCKEIEEHMYRSLSYSKYHLGLAKMRLNNYGYNDEKTSFLKVPIREFHPIGKLSRLTLRFETDSGELYDFKGVNHNLVFAIFYYEPKQENTVIGSVLNPDYEPNFEKYLYKQEEQEGESDDDIDDSNDFSRDNIDIYKKRELEYSKQGIQNKNDTIAYNYRKKQLEKNLTYFIDSDNTLSSSSEQTDSE